MKRFILVMACLLIMISAKTQQTDKRIANLLNNSDWFGLQEEIQTRGDSIQTPFLKLLSQAMLAFYGNKPEETIRLVNLLMDKHQKELDFPNMVNLLALKYTSLKTLGAYQQIDQELTNTIKQFKKQNKTEELKPLENILYNNKPRIGYAPLSIVKPTHDVTVPISIDTVKAKKMLEWFRPSKTNRGHIMTIPVTVHNRQYPFIFDTGASSTFLSDRMARQLGVKIFEDTMMVNRQMPIREGYLESLKIGDITIRNIMVYVGMPSQTDSIFTFDAILGLDCLKAIGESQIYYADRKIVFPAQFTPLPKTGSNLLIDNIPVFKAYQGTTRLDFKLDTGDDAAELSSRYYQTHKKEVDATGVVETITKGMYNHIFNTKVALIPYVTFNVGYRKLTITPIYVSLDTANRIEKHDGVMGMELIRLTRKATINFKDMFLKLE